LRITGKVPWSTVSSGLAATIAFKSGSLHIHYADPRVVAGEGRVVGVSGRGVVEERSALRRLALALRCAPCCLSLSVSRRG
jgi:hypothetical protein